MKLNLKEDAWPLDEETKKIRKLLEHFSQQHTYPKNSANGLEYFFLELAKGMDEVAIAEKSANNWCLFGKDGIQIHCHIIPHNEYWTFSTTIIRDAYLDLSSLEFQGHDDLWVRSMHWLLAVRPELESSIYSRLDFRPIVSSMVKELTQKIEQILNQMGLDSSLPDNLTIALNDWRMLPGKIASYSHPNDMTNWGILTIHTRALSDREYLTAILKHELIHGAIRHLKLDSHGQWFHKIADKLELPTKYRD